MSTDKGAIKCAWGTEKLIADWFLKDAEEFARQKKISLRKDRPGRRNSTIKEGRLMPR